MQLAFEHRVPLATLNTLGLDAWADDFIDIVSVAQLIRLIKNGELTDRRVVVLGGGSNVVLNPRVDGVVLRIALPGRELIGEDDAAWYVRAGAGENWHGFVRWTLEQGWGGLENLSFIPGTVGASPIQNIGAYGIEMSDRFFALEAVDLKSGAVITFDREACRFGYRDSVFKQEAADRFVIASVTFRLPKQWSPLLSYADVEQELVRGQVATPTALDVSDAVVQIRSRKLPDPSLLGNAGSFFKNPVVSAERYAALSREYPNLPHYPQTDGTVKISAGWLIDQAGWKGRDLGPVGMYERQALILVNRGGATGEDVLLLADTVRAAVRERFGVNLEQEPVLV
ncbi:MAG: UDP-N-acetylmuramate dehydrogenase [Rhodocyclaceae bacterium]